MPVIRALSGFDAMDPRLMSARAGTAWLATVWLATVWLATVWLVTCLALPTGSRGDAAAQTAELVITQGRLFRGVPPAQDVNAPTALAVRQGKISWIGDDQQAQSHIGPQTRHIQAGGATVTAGLSDAHVHFLSGSLSLSQVDLADASTVEQIGDTIKAFVQKHPDQPVIVGRGWLYGSFAGGLPDRALLDRFVPDRPAVMRCYDGHTVWVNSLALKAAGITKTTADPDGGVIVRDPDSGEPTGVLKEAAQSLVDKVIPQPTREQKLAALRRGISEAHRFGVTSVCEAGIGLSELELLDTLRMTGELQLRYAIALEGRPRMLDTDFDALDTLKARFDKLQIQAVKLYADGVIESHTAALLAPYANRPDSYGLPETTRDDLTRIVTELDRRGWQIMVHAIGDGGIRMTLDAMAEARRLNPQGPRHRLEHIESISQPDIARLGQLGILASMQPYHANPNSNIFNVWAVNLGPERASRAWAWKSLQDAGARLAFGSDWPVVSIDPRLGIHTALTRQTLDGQPPSGFLPEQRLSLPEVLNAYTSGAAFAQMAEQRQGQLAIGQLADIVLWNTDLFALPVQQVHRARVTTTIFNGRVVYAEQLRP